MTGFFNLAVAITTIDAQFACMHGVVERTRLDGLVANSGIFGGEIVSEPGRERPPNNQQGDQYLQWRFIGLFRENGRHVLLAAQIWADGFMESKWFGIGSVQQIHVWSFNSIRKPGK